MAGCDMSCDFLLSLRKLLSWLFAFLMALLPQHLIAQLADADLSSIAAYTTVASAPGAAPVGNSSAQSLEEDKPVANRSGASNTRPRPMR